MPDAERRLAAIMFTDIVGYTSLAQKDESSALQALENHRSLLRPLFTSRGGREIKTIGDAFLIEFQSALSAVLCAVAIQQMMHDRKLSTGDMISLRIGIHVGDVVEQGGDILGDAVNMSSRIETLAEPDGICISREVYDQVRNKSDLRFASLGEKTLKNMSMPVEAFKVLMPWKKSAQSAARSFPSNRVAILPFVSMSTSPEDAFFADGMTEEIISTVSGISGLKVISRTSVMGYKGTTKRVEEIGRELKVGSVLEGSFRKAGNRIRVTTQLINVADDVHLWAQNYDRDLDDVFEVQSDVATQVAEALKVRILSSERERLVRRPTENTSAYGLYLKGKHYLNKRGLEDLKKAKEYFELATHEDSDFALGYVGVSDCSAVLRSNWRVEPEANLIKAKATVEKALELDPLLAEAHATRGLLLSQEYDQRGAEHEFRKAVELKPSYAYAHMWYYLLLVSQLRWDDALAQIEKAVELDPLAPVVYGNLGGYYWFRGDYNRAIELWRKAIDLGMVTAHSGVGQAYGKLGKFDDMKREFETFVELCKDSDPLAKLSTEAWTAFFMDDKSTMRRLIQDLEGHFNDERGPDAYTVAAIHFHLGEKDTAFEWLERSYSRKEGSLLDIRADQLIGFFEGIQDDPRYLDLVKRLGLS